MRVTLLPSASSQPPEPSNLYLTSYLIDGVVAIDAGALGLMQSVTEQSRVRHVFISHSHMDHIATLPLFIDNVYQSRRDCVTVYGSESVLESLRRDMFNGRVWPDYVAMSPADAPFLRLAALRSGESVAVEGLKITPVSVNHTVPTQGFIIEGHSASIVIASDTGPTEEIWRRANQLPSLRAVFLEASFPNSLAQMADLTKHLTPKTFAAEVAKLSQAARVLAVHLKARWRDQIVHELTALNLPGVEIVRPGNEYVF